MDMHRFRNLDVWKRSVALTTATYDATEHFPHRETYGLQAQMRRAAVSIPSSIAEGTGAGGQKAFSRYLRIAYGSACELETQVVVARDLDLIGGATADPILSELDEVRRMVYSLLAKPA